MANRALLLDADWSRGQIRDAPRGSIPEGGLYNSVDFLLHKPGMAMKRGGTAYAGPALTAANYAAGVAYAEFPGGAQLCGIGDNGHLYTVTAGTTTDAATLGSAFATVDTPKFRAGAGSNLLVICANDGTTKPKVYTGASSGDLDSTAPAGKYCCIYKTRIVLAGTSANPDRLYFSPLPNPRATWDTTESWVDTDYPVTGLAALQNAILVFSARRLQRITGTTPPPGTDFDRQPIADIGCIDARSIVVFEGNAIFANQKGVFSSNGTQIQNLTWLAGNETYWQSILAAYDPSTWTIASGIIQSYLVVCVMNGSTFVDCLMFNLRRPAWWRVSNVKARMFANTVGAADELYYADRSTNRVVAMSGMFSPSGSNKNDADGTAVTPVWVSRLLGAGPTLKHFLDGRLSMDMRDAASDNPTMAVTVAPGLEATSSSAVPESPLVEKTDNNRYRFTIAKVSQGVTVSLAQTNASAKTELYGLEIDAIPLQPGAGGQ